MTICFLAGQFTPTGTTIHICLTRPGFTRDLSKDLLNQQLAKREIFDQE